MPSSQHTQYFPLQSQLCQLMFSIGRRNTNVCDFNTGCFIRHRVLHTSQGASYVTGCFIRHRVLHMSQGALYLRRFISWWFSHWVATPYRSGPVISWLSPHRPSPVISWFSPHRSCPLISWLSPHRSCPLISWLSPHRSCPHI